MRRALISAGVLVALLLLAAFGAAEVLSRPASRLVGAPPAQLQAELVTLRTKSQLKVAGWFAQGRPGAGAVLLLHGVRGDRRDMLGRAFVLHEAGYAVMLIDLPAHGESEGDRITFGLHEAAGVTAALDFLRSRVPAERIGVIGVSLGAAALLFSRSEPVPAAVVLESMYRRSPKRSKTDSLCVSALLGRYWCRCCSYNYRCALASPRMSFVRSTK